MKRIFALWMAFLMIFPLMVACGDTESDPADTDAPEQSEEECPQEGTDDGAGDRLRESYASVTAEGYENGPYLIETVFPTDEVLIANVIVTEADPTGKSDSTAAIQAALDACAQMGGGTVFLPEGEYLVSKTVTVPAGVTLQGDWQDPKGVSAPSFGTVILAALPALGASELADETAGVLFYLDNEGGANNGLAGLTVYYPEQSETAVVPYGYAVYSEHPSMTVLRKLTLINAYRGIGAGLGGSTHELFQIEGIRMTALSVGYKAYGSREVGYASDILISPDVWAGAGKYACESAEALRDYTYANAVGMEFGDLDLNHYSEITVTGCHTALLLQSNFWGVFYDVTVSDCDYGIVALGMAAHNVLMSRVSVGADTYAVANYAAGDAALKIADLTLTGKGGVACVEGARVMVDENVDLEKDELPEATHQKPASHLYVAALDGLDRKTEDAAPAIQTALDAAAATGGVVYLPNGIYSLYSPLRVPAGVELRGGVDVAVRDRASTSGTIFGTALLCYLADDAQITLGDGAGVRGLRLFYPANDPLKAKAALEGGEDVADECVGIRGAGDGVYVVNTVLSGCYVGVDVSESNDYCINQLFGCAYRNMVFAGGEGGVIEGVLANQTYLLRQPFITRNLCDGKYTDKSSWGTYGNEANAAGVAVLRDSVLRAHTTLIFANYAKGLALRDCFMFASHSLLEAYASEVDCYNVTSDMHDGVMFRVEGGSSVTARGALRTTGGTHACDESSSLEIYSRIVSTNPYEPSYSTSLGLAETAGGEVIGSSVLLDCDSTKGVSGAVVSKDAAYVKSGAGSLKKEKRDSVSVLSAVCTPVDATRLPEGELYLHLWIYVGDTSAMTYSNASYVRLGATSGGTGPAYRWTLTSYITHEGWNELYLPFKGAARLGKTAVDDTALQHLSLSLAFSDQTKSPDVYVDDVTVCSLLAYSETSPVAPTAPQPYRAPTETGETGGTRILIHDGESLDLLTEQSAKGMTLNTDKAYVKEGSASLKSSPQNDQYIELAFPATNATKYKKGYLHLWVYVKDIGALKNGGQIELTSSGKSDRGELYWQTTDYLIDNGWNELYLPLDSARNTNHEGEVFDISHVNYLRIHAPRSGQGTPVFYFDDIYLCDSIGASYDESNTLPLGGADDYKEELPMVNGCENTRGTKNVELCDDPTYVKQGDYSFKSTASDSNGRFAYTFTPLDITEYMSGYVHLWIYVDSAQGITGQIELTSSGNHDKNELSWRIEDTVKKDGWNEIWLRIGSGMPTGGAFNAKQFNHIRIYILNKEGYEVGEVYFDDIRLSLTKE